jgi:hypothetical protein
MRRFLSTDLVSPYAPTPSRRCQLAEVVEKLQAVSLAFLRVKLHSVHVLTVNARRHRATIFASCHNIVVATGSQVVTVNKVKARPRFDPPKQWALAMNRQYIPTHVRDP